VHLKQLQYVVEIAKCKSFSKASKKLYVAQPSLSTSISALEEELGVRIFYRTTHGVVVTEEGKKVLEQAEAVLESLDNLSHIADNVSPAYTATLAAVPVANNSLTVALLATLAREHPEIILNILEVRPQKILSNIANGLADFAIGSYTAVTQKQTLEEAQKNNLILEPLLTDSFFVLLPRNHAKAHQPYVTLKEMEEEKQAIFNDFLVIEDADIPLTNEKRMSNCYMFSDLSGIKQAVAAELAYAVLPRQIVLDDVHINSGLIKALPIGDSTAQVTTYLAWRKSNYSSKQEMVVLEQIRTLYKNVESRLERLNQSVHVKETEHSITRY